MADFTLKWSNTSPFRQEWDIIGRDSFSLESGYVCTASLDQVQRDYTLAIAVGTTNEETYAQLHYVAHTKQWTLYTLFPSQWEIERFRDTITVRCLLAEKGREAPGHPLYFPEEPSA